MTPVRRLDGLRFAIGTLSVIPVAVTRVDRDVARAGMLWAPAVGALIGLVLAALFLAVRAVSGENLLAAALAVAAGGLLTRGLHLDGLADVADGLGSGRPAPDALAIMKKSDIGPFGVVTLACTLLIQVSALTAAGRHGLAVVTLVTAATAGRLALPWACRRGVPAARADGLGAMVAGTVPWPAAAAVTVVVLAGSAVLGGIAGSIGSTASPGFGGFGTAPGTARVPGALLAPGAVLAGLLVAGLFRRHLRRRLGGITGDVLGALVEIATTVALLVTALA